MKDTRAKRDFLDIMNNIPEKGLKENLKNTSLKGLVSAKCTKNWLNQRKMWNAFLKLIPVYDIEFPLD